MPRLLIVPVVLALAPAGAAAGVSGFRLSELATASATGDPAARYLELEATAAGCVFPSTEVVAYDSAGAVLGQAAPFASSTCFPAGRFLVIATPAAQLAFATAADAALVPALPALAGQLCLVSSTTRYDCVRWGAIARPVHDLFAPTDDSAGFGPPAGLALARRADTGVVADDWRVETPSPRRANDGAGWDQGDAGLDAATPGDAAPAADAGPPVAPADAGNQGDPAVEPYLDLDPGGGARCGCGTDRGRGAALPVALVALIAGRRRGRHPGRPG